MTFTGALDPGFGAPWQQMADICLELLVPLHIAALSGRSADELHRLGVECAEVLAMYGDSLTHGPGGKTRGKVVAAGVNALAVGLACTAVRTGGARFRGMRWGVS